MNTSSRLANQRGFTLIEVMIVVAVVGILSTIAMPSYADYVRRSRIPIALTTLMLYSTRMEQQFQDTGTYIRSDACAVSVPSAPNFVVKCDTSTDGRGFMATATGTGPLDGYSYSIDQFGNRQTLRHPKGVPAQGCWTIKGSTCDA